MEKIKIGQVVNVVGLKGELKVYHYSDYKERFEEFDNLYLDQEHHLIEKVRYQGHMVILKLKGIDNRDAAEAQKNKDVFITEAELRELPEGTYYIKDMIGMTVTEQGAGRLGVLIDVMKNTAQDLYEVELENKKRIYIPVVDEFVLDINMESKTILVKLPEGLLDL